MASMKIKPASGATQRTGVGPWQSSLITAASFALVFGALALVWLLARPLTLLLVAIVIAQALAPVVTFLCRWLPRVISTIIVYLVVFGLIAGAVWIVLPDIIEQGQQLVEAAPDYLVRAQELAEALDGNGSDQVIEAAQASVQGFSDLLVALPLTIFSSLIDLVLVIFMSIYWLVATPKLHNFAMSLFPAEGRGRAADALQDMGATMGGFVRGTFIDGALVALLAYAGFTVIGLEYAILLAVIQGLGEIIPIVGPIVAAVPSILVGLLDSPQQALIVLIFILVLQQIESNILVPLIMRSQADIPPLVSLTAILAGSALGGLLGALIAIPLGGAAQIFVVRVIAPAIRRLAGIGDEPQVLGADPPDDD